MSSLFDFEHDLRPLERELESWKRRGGNGAQAEQEERLKSAIDDRLREIYRRLTPWEKVQVRATASDRTPWTTCSGRSSDFVELHGDRSYADDRAIVGGPAHA